MTGPTPERPDDPFAIAVAALRRIAGTAGLVADTAALWKIAGDALDAIDGTTAHQSSQPGEP